MSIRIINGKVYKNINKSYVVRKIEKSEQNKVGKNEKIGIIRLEKLNIMYKSGLEKL